MMANSHRLQWDYRVLWLITEVASGWGVPKPLPAGLVWGEIVPAKWQQWMPFQIDRFRGSPDVQAMHPIAKLGFIYLLAAQWQTNDCALPSDSLDLAALSSLGDDFWLQYSPRILRKFEVTSDGKLRNLVCFEEWKEAKRIFDARRESALRTTKIRSPKDNGTVTVENHNGDRTVTDGGPSRPAYTRTGTLTGTGTLTKTKELKTARKSAPEIALPDWVPLEPWNAFVEMRKDIKHPLSATAAKIAIGDLDRLRQSGFDLAEVLNQSTMRSWRGLFEVKTGGSNGKSELQRALRIPRAAPNANHSGSIAAGIDAQPGD